MAIGTAALGQVLPEALSWEATAPLVAVKPDPADDWHAIKDPTIVQDKGAWHLFCTVRGTAKSHGIVYSTFKDFDEAASARQTTLTCHEGFFCAPQVFYYEPHQLWYLICQASDETWEPKYQPAYSTTANIADPTSWSKLKPLGCDKGDAKAWLDFWVICDDANAHLFFTSLDGNVWRAQTSRQDFPAGWSKPTLAIKGDLFEASHTYHVAGTGQYLTIVEAQNGSGWRYMKSYVADRLEGPWREHLAARDAAFASMANVSQPTKWTDVISHVELIRAGGNERLEVNPADMTVIFQGVSDTDRAGKQYGQIPWRLGLLRQR